MFEDFEKSDSASEGRGRMGVSVLLSAGVFGGIAAAIGAAIATAHVVVKKRQNDVQIAFAELPRAPKPKPAPVAKAKGVAPKKVIRAATAAAPKEIPKERPEEAEGELVATEGPGPVDAVVEKAHAPAPTVAAQAPVAAAPKPQPLPAPPEQAREEIAKPRFISGCRAPEVPENLQTLAATVSIDVRMMIGADGKVQSATILKRSHNVIPDELILRCVREQQFEPAHLPDGTAVLFPFHRRFVFKPSAA